MLNSKTEKTGDEPNPARVIVPIAHIDPIEAKKRRKERFFIILVAVVFALTTYFEIRLSNLSNRLPFVNSIFFFGLINFNIVLLMVLVLLISRNVGKLFLERRRQVLGARLKTKLVAAFVCFSIVPTIILFLISSLYINSSFDKWFSLKVQNTLQGTLEITETYYKNTGRIAQYLAMQLARELTAQSKLNPKLVYSKIATALKTPTVDAVEVYHSPFETRIIEMNSSEKILSGDLPYLPHDLLKKAFQGENQNIVQHLGGADLIRAISPVYSSKGTVKAAVAITFIIPASVTSRVDEISTVFNDYREVNPLKYPMKTTYFLILVMMTLLIMFVSIWIGLYLARELTVPLERLAAGTQKIREGNLDFEISNPGSDELAVLTSSFNSMTQELKVHRRELESKHVELEEKSAYVAAILNHVSAGVISVDLFGTITTVNESAERLLRIHSADLLGKSIADPNDVFTVVAALSELFERIQRQPTKASYLQKQFAVAHEAQSFELMVTASPFPGGVVFVINDMSHLAKAQREAAWREVARRVAHEIKNPLTPIKLSAQRLQRKFASSPSHDAQVFRECTDTIIKNVDALRDMVDEFSSFARFPLSNPTPNDLNAALKETLILYEEAHRSIHFVFEPEQRLPIVHFDLGQIKRVIINLLDNAVAVLADGVGQLLGGPKIITVRTHFNEHLDVVAIEVIDNGPGMTDAVKSRLFEPYFSTKANGTGLGLAIVKRIVADHRGYIRVESREQGGTKFTVELPVHLLDDVVSDKVVQPWPEIYS